MLLVIGFTTSAFPSPPLDVLPAVYGFASRAREGFLSRDEFTAWVALRRVDRLAGVGRCEAPGRVLLALKHCNLAYVGLGEMKKYE